MDIFTNSGDLKVGRAITSTASLPASISLTDSSGKASEFSSQGFAVITGFEFVLGTNYQIMQSLDDLIYLYTFGDKPATLTLKGLAFAEVCTITPGVASGDVITPYGFDNLLNFYARNKITSRIDGSIPQVTITIGTISIRGFLVECAISMSDPVHRVTAFTMTIKVAGKISV